MRSSSNERVGLTLPRNVKPEALMDALTKGHGYQWLAIAKLPMLLVYGETSSEEMPQILLTGNTRLVVSTDDSAYVERLRRMLEILERQEERQLLAREGGGIE